MKNTLTGLIGLAAMLAAHAERFDYGAIRGIIQTRTIVDK